MSRVTNNTITALVRQRFGKDLEIVDARRPLRITPLPVDAKGADCKSPDNCLLVHTCERMFGAKVPIFWKATAYVDLPDAKGKRRIERFSLPKNARKTIESFDRGKPIKVGAGIVLEPPTGTNRLKARRRTNRTYHQSDARQAFYKLGSAQKSEQRATERVEAASEAWKRRPTDLNADRLRDERVRLREAKAKVRAARVKVEQTKASPTWRKMKPRRFDLTTRNGAIGNYNFVRA